VVKLSKKYGLSPKECLRQALNALAAKARNININYPQPD